MASVRFIQKKNLGRIADRLDFAVGKYTDAQQKLKELLDLGKSILQTAEYAEVKMEVLYWHRRVSELKKLCYSTYKKKTGTEIGLGSTVKVRYGAVMKEYTIVTSLEADPANGYISVDSPLGRALVNKRVNEDVSVKAPSGDFVYSIEAVV
ncbi:GreA/GreB family elongation factor [Patescibacteria group bacterium]|nr:GreA/GreB family elongation factor [Patescibacteria group bacterium]